MTTNPVHSRYARTLENLARLVPFVDRLMIHDNSETTRPRRPVALFEYGMLIAVSPTIPAWLEFLDLPSRTTDDTAVIET